jgi:hypothetical protein
MRRADALTTAMQERMATIAAHPASRRGFLTGSAKLAGGGALALVAAGAPIGGALREAAAQTTFANDLEVFNYALTLEHLEYAFYRDGLDQFSAADFEDAGYGAQVYEYFGLIRDHEGAHVDTISSTIAAAGGDPVEEAVYDFGYEDVDGFVGVAQALENTGVAAYTGAAASISDGDLLTAALTIHGVEARHAAYLNELVGDVPFPEAFETPLTPDEVLAIAGPFIVGSGDDGTDGTTTMPSTGQGPSVPGLLQGRW